jgi:formylglycine-generating enzyme required for sulfatase activity
MTKDMSEGHHSRCYLEVPGAKIELILVPTGHFEMGSTNQYFSESPVHRVTIPRSFYLSKFPITQRQWVGIYGLNPSKFQISA